MPHVRARWWLQTDGLIGRGTRVPRATTPLCCSAATGRTVLTTNSAGVSVDQADPGAHPQLPATGRVARDLDLVTNVNNASWVSVLRLDANVVIHCPSMICHCLVVSSTVYEPGIPSSDLMFWVVVGGGVDLNLDGWSKLLRRLLV